MNYGEHTPYVLAAYGLSIVVVSILIVMRWVALRHWRRRERSDEQARER